MEPLYQPRSKYRERFFSPLGWVCISIMCWAFLLWVVGMIWMAYAIHHS